MNAGKPMTAIGLMSGTSMDGVDAALIETDGERINRFGPVHHAAYDEKFRGRIRNLLGVHPEQNTDCDAVTRTLTQKHADAVNRLLADNGFNPGDIDIIGFHGQTVYHNPAEGISHQIGDGSLLAELTGIPVINDFRSADVAAGGQGAPLAPLYHAALARDLDKPVAVLNIGGIANVTWIGAGQDLLAFDTGPGNCLIDDWLLRTIEQPFDDGGRLAGTGHINQDILATLLTHQYFSHKPPKSLDRLDFTIDAVTDLSPEDGAATLTAFTVHAIAKALDFFSESPRQWLVCGGGRHNQTMMNLLGQELKVPVQAVEAVGWSGDALEAQAFGFLAVRSHYDLPLTLPTTTGVKQSTTGGTRHQPPG